jgi:hypothetical protein
MDLTNEAILETIEQEVLHPEVVRRALRRVLNALNAPTDTVVPHRTALQAELAVLEQELARLAAGVAQGGDLKVLLDEPGSSADAPSKRSWPAFSASGPSRRGTSSSSSGTWKLGSATGGVS